MFGDLLVVGVLAEQSGQLVNDLSMTPQTEFDDQTLFECVRAFLVQPCRIDLQDPAGDVGQGTPAPAGQRPPKCYSCLGRVRVPFGEAPLVVELQQVELIRGQVDLVAAAPRTDQGAWCSARGEVAAQPGDGVLDLTDRSGGRCLHGDDVVGVDQKRGQHLGLPRSV